MMERREFIRQSSGAVAVGIASGLAGCGGSSGGSSEDSASALEGEVFTEEGWEVSDLSQSVTSDSISFTFVVTNNSEIGGRAVASGRFYDSDGVIVAEAGGGSVSSSRLDTGDSVEGELSTSENVGDIVRYELLIGRYGTEWPEEE